MTVLHPAYFPNVAFLSVYTKAKNVVLEMQDNYQKQTYRNRAYICTDRGKHLLSIPIVHTKGATGRQCYKDVKLDNSYPWQRQHWRTLETAYRTSPFFEFYEDEIKPLYEKEFELLLDFNLASIQTICDCLQLDFVDEFTDIYSLEYEKDYRYLVNAKKEVPYEFPEYVQVFGDRHGFIPNLSILDVLFNLGPNTAGYISDIEIPFSNA
ncbi:MULTISPECIES: WbqC family protein [Maribacter]|uniref:WbqC family protein n=1 Tax=Maribacter flavus TaxID=1658664 RepID=A0ABU7INB4_9FLAO|nr:MULTISPECIES: WbqC family protein [Maribacter]MDC6406956.1 WbqC family protein [Maribacter sp. PR66]MEE1974071.1 WbqC family protein [Maribacter flavus]